MIGRFIKVHVLDGLAARLITTTEDPVEIMISQINNTADKEENEKENDD